MEVGWAETERGTFSLQEDLAASESEYSIIEMGVVLYLLELRGPRRTGKYAREEIRDLGRPDYDKIAYSCSDYCDYGLPLVNLSLCV